MTASTQSLSIDIVSDVVCPWCYIGKRRLEAARRELSAAGEFPHRVVNDDLERASRELERLVATIGPL